MRKGGMWSKLSETTLILVQSFGGFYEWGVIKLNAAHVNAAAALCTVMQWQWLIYWVCSSHKVFYAFV